MHWWRELVTRHYITKNFEMKCKISLLIKLIRYFSKPHKDLVKKKNELSLKSLCIGNNVTI